MIMWNCNTLLLNTPHKSLKQFMSICIVNGPMIRSLPMGSNNNHLFATGSSQGVGYHRHEGRKTQADESRPTKMGVERVSLNH